MSSRNSRASAVHVGLPFRGVWALWGGVYTAADRAHAAFLYRDVFNPNRWIPANPQDESWAEAAQQSEAWTPKSKQPEVWTAKTQQSEIWTEKTKQSETWTRNYDD